MATNMGELAAELGISPKEVESFAERIKHILDIYPVVSPSMLQVGMGTSLSPAIWKPVLEYLISVGEIVREEVTARTPYGQHRSYIKLSLSGSL